jgi:hypothetical protein
VAIPQANSEIRKAVNNLVNMAIPPKADFQAG